MEISGFTSTPRSPRITRAPGYDSVGGMCPRENTHDSNKMLFENSNQLFEVEHCKMYSKSTVFPLEKNVVQRMS